MKIIVWCHADQLREQTMFFGWGKSQVLTIQAFDQKQHIDCLSIMATVLEVKIKTVAHPGFSQSRKCHCEPPLFGGEAVSLHDLRLLRPAEERRARNDMP